MNKVTKVNLNKSERKLSSIINKISKAKNKRKNLKIAKWATDVNLQTLNMSDDNKSKHYDHLNELDDKIEIIDAKTEVLVDQYNKRKPEFLENLKESQLPQILVSNYETEIEYFESNVLTQ